MHKLENYLKTLFKKGVSLSCLWVATCLPANATQSCINQNSAEIIPQDVQNNYHSAINTTLNFIQNSLHQSGNFIQENGTQCALFIQNVGKENYAYHLTNPISKIIQAAGDVGMIVINGSGDLIKRTQPAFSFPFHLIESTKTTSPEITKTWFTHIQDDLLASLTFCVGESVKIVVYSGFRITHLAKDITTDIFHTTNEFGKQVSTEAVEITNKGLKKSRDIFYPNSDPFLPIIDYKKTEKQFPPKKKKQQENKNSQSDKKPPYPFSKPKKLYAHCSPISLLDLTHTRS